MERLNQPYVALVSTATEGFLTVEPPPHKLALLVHGHLPEHLTLALTLTLTLTLPLPLTLTLTLTLTLPTDH